MQKMKTTPLICAAAVMILAGLAGCSTNKSGQAAANDNQPHPNLTARPNPTPSTITQRGTLLQGSFYDNNNQVGQ